MKDWLVKQQAYYPTWDMVQAQLDDYVQVNGRNPGAWYVSRQTFKNLLFERVLPIETSPMGFKTIHYYTIHGPVEIREVA